MKTAWEESIDIIIFNDSRLKAMFDPSEFRKLSVRYRLHLCKDFAAEQCHGKRPEHSRIARVSEIIADEPTMTLRNLSTATLVDSLSRTCSTPRPTYLNHGIALARRIHEHKIALHANHSLHRKHPFSRGVLVTDEISYPDAPSSPIVFADEEPIPKTRNGRQHGNAISGFKYKKVSEKHMHAQAKGD